LGTFHDFPSSSSGDDAYYCTLPPRPVVILATSPHYQPPPGYWRDRYFVTGFITNDDEVERNAHLPASTDGFLRQCADLDRAVVCIDFGSMTALIESEYDVEPFAEAIVNIAESRDDNNFAFIIVLHAFSGGRIQSALASAMNRKYSFGQKTIPGDTLPVGAATDQQQPPLYISAVSLAIIDDISFTNVTPGLCTDTIFLNPQRLTSPIAMTTLSAQTHESCTHERMHMHVPVHIPAHRHIHVIHGDVPHAALFRHCVAVIHHGGAGTLGTCLRWGIPQGKMNTIK
jgi:hypothetical protein